MNKISLLLLVLILFAALSAQATEEYAAETGQDCAVCHLDPAGGGELTQAGAAYQGYLAQATEGVTESGFSLVRLVVGYLHLLFALFWFGTILYVHLILKPAYASGGLPRGEVRLGVLSMIIMGITGAILMAYRVPDLAFLVSTRFGVLLLIKVGLYLVMVLSAAYVVLVIGPKLRKQKRPASQACPVGNATLEQLAACDGKEGRPTRFAYQGTIFDASNSKLWRDGQHVKRHDAGTDLSEFLSQAPHGPEVLERISQVGRILPSTTETPLHQKVFYFMAYMNLIIVLLITLVVALWRWG
jgi:predicted heme/steroid binding protein